MDLRLLWIIILKYLFSFCNSYSSLSSKLSLFHCHERSSTIMSYINNSSLELCNALPNIADLCQQHYLFVWKRNALMPYRIHTQPLTNGFTYILHTTISHLSRLYNVIDRWDGYFFIITIYTIDRLLHPYI